MTKKPKTFEELKEDVEKNGKNKCYFCNSSDVVEILRVSESPRDVISVPVCQKCYNIHKNLN